MDKDKIKKVVREDYARVAKRQGSCGCGTSSSCCSTLSSEKVSMNIGYSSQELESVPEGSNLGLGCGNPVALASLKVGETVLDLGSGGGFDCFLAAKKVGEKGKVIGVDMTPEMIDKARRNALRSKYKNVEFRLGEIENLPVADNTVDTVISNCVINLSPDKGRVFSEAFRVLKPGGRLIVSDIVLSKKLPRTIENNVEAYVSCVSGAVLRDEYVELIEQAGFKDVKVIKESHFLPEQIINSETAKVLQEKSKTTTETIKEVYDSVISANVHAVKP